MDDILKQYVDDDAADAGGGAPTDDNVEDILSQYLADGSETPQRKDILRVWIVCFKSSSTRTWRNSHGDVYGSRNER